MDIIEALLISFAITGGLIGFLMLLIKILNKRDKDKNEEE